MKCYHCRDYGCRYCTKKELTIVIPCINKGCPDYSEITFCNCGWGKPVPMRKYKGINSISYVKCKEYIPKE